MVYDIILRKVELNRKIYNTDDSVLKTVPSLQSHSFVMDHRSVGFTVKMPVSGKKTSLGSFTSWIKKITSMNVLEENLKLCISHKCGHFNLIDCANFAFNISAVEILGTRTHTKQHISGQATQASYSFPNEQEFYIFISNACLISLIKSTHQK